MGRQSTRKYERYVVTFESLQTFLNFMSSIHQGDDMMGQLQTTDENFQTIWNLIYEFGTFILPVSYTNFYQSDKYEKIYRDISLENVTVPETEEIKSDPTVETP